MAFRFFNANQSCYASKNNATNGTTNPFQFVGSVLEVDKLAKHRKEQFSTPPKQIKHQIDLKINEYFQAISQVD